MADELGVASLRVEVDLSALEAGLKKARRDIETLSSTSVRVGGSTVSNRGAGGPILGGGFNVAAQKASIAADQQLQEARKKTATATLAAVTSEKAATNSLKNLQAGLQGLSSKASGIATSAVIGGAFPLLFGQGAGASIGGFTGGLLGSALGPGGGFAGSLFGTIVGQTADTFNQLAEAIQKPLQALPQLIEGANLSGPGVELLAQTLVGLGRTAEAEALILSDLSRSLRPETAITAAAAQDEYQRSIAELQTRIGAFLSGPALQFSDWLAGLAERVAGIPAAGAAPSSQQALALRGLGAGAGIGGLGLLSLALPVGLGLAGLVGGPVGATLGVSTGLAVASAGAGLTTLGGVQIGAAEAEEEQVANAAALKAILSDINDVTAKRIGIQRQLIGLQSDEKSNASEIARLTRDATLAEIEGQKLQLRARLQATPGTLSPEQFKAARQELAALGLQAETAQQKFEQAQRAIAAAFNAPGSTGQLEESLQRANEALSRLAVNANSINFRSAVADVVSLEVELREAQGAIAGVKADILSAGIAAGDFANSFDNVNSVLQNLEQYRNTLDIDSSAFVQATADILQTEDQLQQLNGQKATITVELIKQGFESGSLTNSIANRQKLVSSLKEQALSLDVNSNEYRAAAAAYRREKQVLEKQTADLEGTANEKLQQDLNNQYKTAIQVREQLEKGGETIRNNIESAAKAIESTLKGNYDLLRPELQEQVLRKAQSQINTDIFDISKIGSKPANIFRAADASVSIAENKRSIIENVRALQNNNIAISDNNKLIYNNNIILNELVKKNWSVNVAVNTSTGKSAVQLG